MIEMKNHLHKDFPCRPVIALYRIPEEILQTPKPLVQLEVH